MIRYLLTLTLGLAALCHTASAADERLFELRTYVTHPGKLPNLLKRFREHTCALFVKHGMENIGYWVPTEVADGSENTLIYVIAHKSADAAKASWTAFVTDPDWKAVAKASEEGGKILAQKPGSVFMTATDYSCAIQSADKGERLFELRTYTASPGKLPALHERFRQTTCALFSKHGMTHIGYWEPKARAGGPEQLVYVLAHASKEAHAASFAAFRADPEWIKAKAESEKDGALTVKDGVKSVLLRATDFSPIK